MAIGAEANDDDEDDHGVHDDDVKDVLKCFFAYQYFLCFSWIFLFDSYLNPLTVCYWIVMLSLQVFILLFFLTRFLYKKDEE